MREIIKWVSEGRAEKDIGPAMTHYSVDGGFIRASNGSITCGYPWPDEDAAFLVSGQEFERILGRMEGDDPTVTENAGSNTVTVRSGRFSGTIATLPVDTWSYPGVDDAVWLPIPDRLIEILKSLRVFISDKPVHAWAGCVALENGNCYATNNIAVAGSACDVGEVQALLPSYAIDFLLRRSADLQEWAWTDNFVAFRWGSGAWMRSQLVIGKFPEAATKMVRDVYDLKLTQEITDEFRNAFADVAALAEDNVRIFNDHIESQFKKSRVVAPVECELPITGEPYSMWNAAILSPVIAQATHWQPSLWPKPAPFRGDNIAGFIAGRKI